MLTYKTSNYDSVEKGILADNFLKCETGDSSASTHFAAQAEKKARFHGPTSELISEFSTGTIGNKVVPVIFTNGQAVTEVESPAKHDLDTSEISEIKAVQDTITQVLSINLSLLSKVLGVERKTLYNHRERLPRDSQGYHRLLQLSEEIRTIAPHGLEAGTRTIFIDGQTLKDFITQHPGDIEGIADFALRVANKWHLKHG